MDDIRNLTPDVQDSRRDVVGILAKELPAPHSQSAEKSIPISTKFNISKSNSWWSDEASQQGMNVIEFQLYIILLNT